MNEYDRHERVTLNQTRKVEKMAINQDMMA